MNWSAYTFLYPMAVLALAFNSAALKAQSNRGSPKDAVRESNRQELDNLLLRKPILTAEDKSARRAVLQQINDDFKALQVLNNKVMSEVTRAGEVDYKSISNWIAEIGSKASRLKANMVLPKVETEKSKVASETINEARLRNDLMALDKVVMAFVTNEVFKSDNVIQLDLATKASKDLSEIIEQSRTLKKAAALLAKK